MNRLVTYGDSFTNYKWSTWADLLAKTTESDLLNRADRGAGNNFISYRIENDIKRGIISKNDTVKIMWSIWNRVVDILDENTFRNRSENLSIDTAFQVYDNNHQIIRDTEQLLIEHDFDYEFLFWLPMNNNLPNYKNFPTVELDKILTKPFPQSLFDIVYNSDWTSRQDFAIQTEEIPKHIFKHIQKLSIKQNIGIVDLIRSQDWLGNGESLVFYDLHPTPAHHLEFLQTIYPDLEWANNLIAEINLENQEVLSTLW